MHDKNTLGFDIHSHHKIEHNMWKSLENGDIVLVQSLGCKDAQKNGGVLYAQC